MSLTIDGSDDVSVTSAANVFYICHGCQMIWESDQHLKEHQKRCTKLTEEHIVVYDQPNAFVDLSVLPLTPAINTSTTGNICNDLNYSS